MGALFNGEQREGDEQCQGGDGDAGGLVGRADEFEVNDVVAGGEEQSDKAVVTGGELGGFRVEDCAVEADLPGGVLAAIENEIGGAGKVERQVRGCGAGGGSG